MRDLLVKGLFYLFDRAAKAMGRVRLRTGAAGSFGDRGKYGNTWEENERLAMYPIRFTKTSTIW